MQKFLRKYHKWLGIIISLFLLFFAISGIILNHRQVFSGCDVSRKLLPNNYELKNWNLGSIKNIENIAPDSNLVYGDIGIWLTDNNFSDFSDFSNGMPNGIDNKKVSKIFKSADGKLYAATLFGLYRFDDLERKWKFINLPLHNPRIVDITQKNDTLLVLSRSFLFSSTDGKNFVKHQLKSKDPMNKVSLFKTLWIIHSGEILGTFGKILVDILAIIFIILTISGIVLFANPYLIKRKRKKNRDFEKIKKSSRFNLKWHNKLGWNTVVFLLVLTITGMFLRPPLLIAIATTKVGKIPHTILDTDNPWFDKLRAVSYNDSTQTYIVGTSAGMFYTKDIFNSPLQKFEHHVPISVMGITVLQQKSTYEYLVGSFEGLFLWNTQTGKITDYITKKPYKRPKRKGPPIGRFLVSGYVKINQQECFFDYNKGLCTFDGELSGLAMPRILQQQPISLWNLMLEVHTARFYRAIIGSFYILIIPLVGLMTVFVLISGFFVWNKRHRKRRRK